MSDATSITRSRASAHSLAFSSSSTPGTSVSLWSGDSDVDGDGFLQSSFRAGGPVLASIPAHCAPIRPNSRQNDLNRHSSEIGNRVREILTEYQISPSTVNTWGRISEVRGEPEPIPTVLIAIPHLDPPQSARWREAARTIHAILSPRFPGISVELIDEKLLRIPYCHPVPRSHPIAPRWDRICDDILRTSDVREWTGLACWHYGVESTPTENPVTLIVSVLESATGPFITSLRRIRGILAGYSVKGVDILFMKNERHSNFAQPGIGPKLPVETCDQYVQPGVSIGVQNSSAGSSTLGGFVELKFRNDPAWHPFGLTCFHCVYPPNNHRSNFSNIDGSQRAFASWEYEPVFPGDRIARQLLRVEQPSSYDIRNTIAYMDEEIRSLRNQRFQELHAKVRAIKQGDDDVIMFPSDKAWYEAQGETIKAIQEESRPLQRFIDNGLHKMGHVYAGSGLYRALFMHSKPRMSDWALIEIDRERVPGSDKLFERNKPFLTPQARRPPPFQRGTLRELSEGDELCKTGRTSQFTSGSYGLREVNLVQVRDPNQHEGFKILATWDPAVTSSGRFAERGDSGSFVYTRWGSVMGMLIGGHERLGTWNFCSLEDLFRDIKAITRAEDVRLPIPRKKAGSDEGQS